MHPERVIDIINACKSAGVSEFDGLGLKLKFGLAEPVSLTPSTAPVTEVDPQIVEKLLAEREQEVKLEKLERLRIEDPYEYEQLINQGDLTNDRQADSGVDD